MIGYIYLYIALLSKKKVFDAAFSIFQLIFPIIMKDINLSEVLAYMKKTVIQRSALAIAATLTSLNLYAAPVIDDSLMKIVNTDGDETSCSITANRKFFIFARKPKDKNDSDLFFSEFKDGKWTEAVAATALNSTSDEISPYISPDGTYVLFSSNREGSLKSDQAEKPSYDIYYSQKKGGEWEKPVLLFGVVNTTNDEINPSVSKNGKLLYFTRSLFNDPLKTTVYKVTKKDDFWGDLQICNISNNPDIITYMFRKSSSKPGSYITGFKRNDTVNRDIFYVNSSGNKISELAGKTGPVNTSGDEISFCELSKNSIIVSSNAAGSYDFSIKKITALIKQELPGAIMVKVDSADYTNSDAVKLNVLFFSSLKKDAWPLKSEMRSPDSSGMISITTGPAIKRVLVLPGDTGMKSFAIEFLAKNSHITTATVKIEQAEKKEFTSRPVYFSFNSTGIETVDIPYLHEVIDYLRENPNIKLSLTGYSDGTGSYKTNLDISLKRAEKIKEYIVNAGISRDRIDVKGLGYTEEMISGTSQNNRRVEFSIIN